MKTLLLTLLAAALVVPATSAETKTLSRADLDRLLAQPEKVLIVDVRRPDELTSIGGFPVYLSVQADALEKQLNAIPRDRQIVTVSNHAARATRAGDLLTKHGFTVAGAVGAQDYEAEGGTLVRIAARSGRGAGAAEK
jgi:rhodanese-related sulfurtransferase